MNKEKYNNKLKDLREKFYIEDCFSNKEKGFKYSCNQDGIILSIIVPVYNSEKYLRKCLDSVVRQKTKYCIEIIIVNDGSTDNSKAIINEYKNDERVIVIDKENGGLSSARNCGIKESRGEYLTFVDSDDYIEESYVETLIDSAINENADIVKCGFVEFDDKTGRIIKKTSYNNRVLDYNSNDYAQIKGHGCMCVIKRDIFNNVRFPLGYLYEDLIMLFLVMSQANKIVLIDNCLYCYRVRNTSLSRDIKTKKSYKMLSHFFLTRDILVEYNKLCLPINDSFYRVLTYSCGTMMWLRTRHLDKRTKYNAFYVLACDYGSYKINTKNLTLQERLTCFSLNNKIYFLWKALSMLNMFKVKYLKKNF